jgi:hypothetical protein
MSSQNFRDLFSSRNSGGIAPGAVRVGMAVLFRRGERMAPQAHGREGHGELPAQL